MFLVTAESSINEEPGAVISHSLSRYFAEPGSMRGMSGNRHSNHDYD